MAKFTNKDLRLKDGEKVTLGTDLDANLWYDGVANQLAVDVTVSGVNPTQDYHLTTKWYVDDEINTLSGTLQAGLDHGLLTGLGDDDHSQYIRTDGTRAFTGVVSGVDPTEATHLTTKQYVDSVAQGLDWQDSVINFFDPTVSGVPTGPTAGDRYIASATGNGWTQNNIYEWDGTSWVEMVTNEGTASWNETEDSLYVLTNSGWVKFGSTVLHNNLSSIQGGTSGEYYHLTSDQYSKLTNTGGVVDATDQHTHDDRYYTETEMDLTISGIQSTISDIQGDVSTYSDHGNLYGLADDDHTQYMRVDGFRGFTNTVSGVTPVLGSDLATKDYVDAGGMDRKGRTAIADGASTVTITFADLGTTDYTVNATMENTSDSPPSIYAFIVSAKTTSSFNVTFMGDMDSANYLLNWSVILD